jgi:hypothetical protein
LRIYKPLPPPIRMIQLAQCKLNQGTCIPWWPLDEAKLANPHREPDKFINRFEHAMRRMACTARNCRKAKPLKTE